MFRKCLVFLAILVLAAGVYAGDPWKDKTYKEWDERESRRILNDSPWARVVAVNATWRAQRDQQGPEGGAGRAGGQPEEGGLGGVGATAGGSRSGGGEGVGSEMPRAEFIVRWSSARTARQAVARLAVLGGRPEAEAEKYLSQAVTEHEIVLFGPDMAPFAKTDEIALKEKTFIKPKKTKQKIAPTRIEIRRSEDGKRIHAIVFHFAMNSESGEPIIAPGEKGVEFECRAGNFSIKTGFDLQKMVSKAGADL